MLTNPPVSSFAWTWSAPALSSHTLILRCGESAKALHPNTLPLMVVLLRTKLYCAMVFVVVALIARPRLNVLVSVAIMISAVVRDVRTYNVMSRRRVDLAEERGTHLHRPEWAVLTSCTLSRHSPLSRRAFGPHVIASLHTPWVFWLPVLYCLPSAVVWQISSAVRKVVYATRTDS